MELYKGSVSTVFKVLLVGSCEPLVLKQYHKPRMADKHHHKLAREVGAMRAMAALGHAAAPPGQAALVPAAAATSTASGTSCRTAPTAPPACAGGPTCVALLDTWEDASSVYLLMECCEGGDLFRRLLREGGKLPEPWVAAVVLAPLLRCLAALHGCGLLHRDIKPENIFLTADGTTRLGDFGLALSAQHELPFSRSGTLDYMAPEVLVNPSTHLQESPAVTAAALAAKGIRPYTAAVDVWAAGCLAYELVVGRPPFEVEDEKQTASLIIYSNVIRFEGTPGSPAWADFVTQALIKDPARRPDAATLLGHPWLREAAAAQMQPRAPVPAPVPAFSSQQAGAAPSCPGRQAPGSGAGAAAGLVHVQPKQPAGAPPARPPSANRHGSPLAARAAAAGAGQAGHMTPPPPAAVVSVAAVAAPASAPPAQARPQYPGSSFRAGPLGQGAGGGGLAASGNAGSGSNPALRSLLDAFKNASVSGQAGEAGGAQAAGAGAAGATAAAAPAPCPPPPSPTSMSLPWLQRCESGAGAGQSYGSASYATVSSSGAASSGPVTSSSGGVVLGMGWRPPPAASPIRERPAGPSFTAGSGVTQTAMPSISTAGFASPQRISRHGTAGVGSAGTSASGGCESPHGGNGGLRASLFRPLGSASTSACANGSGSPARAAGHPAAEGSAAGAAATSASGFYTTVNKSPSPLRSGAPPSPPRAHYAPTIAPPAPMQGGAAAGPHSPVTHGSGSASALQELTRNWGAVAAVSVSHSPKVAAANATASACSSSAAAAMRGSGSPGRFASPQRPMGLTASMAAAMASGDGMYGMAPPTPVMAAALAAGAASEYLSPQRPVGLMERVKFHLRGGVGAQPQPPTQPLQAGRHPSPLGFRLEQRGSAVAAVEAL